MTMKLTRLLLRASCHAFVTAPSSTGGRSFWVCPRIRFSPSIIHWHQQQRPSRRTDTTIRRLAAHHHPNNAHDDISPLAASIERSIQQALAEAVQSSSSSSSLSLLDEASSVVSKSKQEELRLVLTLSVSGGCDSMALLHACMEWRNHASSLFVSNNNNNSKETSILISIQVVHFNHQQRGDESDEDMALVQRTCEQYQLPCHVELWKSKEEEEEHHDRPEPESLTAFSQDSARQWRRKRLLELTQEELQAQSVKKKNNNTTASVAATATSVGIILTAHHKDDSVESLLLKALRGVHLLNLSGMTPSSRLNNNDIDNDNDNKNKSFLFLVRPWVQDISKQDLIEYMQNGDNSGRQLEWREDESNASPKYLRNRVRNELIPLLQDLTNDGGGGGVLDSRLSTWMQQSEELAADLQPRVQAHLKATLQRVERSSLGNNNILLFDWEQSCELLRNCNDYSATPLVQSQSLYRWMTELCSASPPAVSHDAFQRLLEQLRQYPERNEWTLELGQGWSVQRKGTVLEMISQKSVLFEETSSTTKDNTITWSWSLDDSIMNTSSGTERNSDRWDASTISHDQPMIVWIPSDWLHDAGLASAGGSNSTVLAFCETTVLDQQRHKTVGSRALTFSPPWKSPASSSIKLRQFLRGQGIPLHQREEIKLLMGRYTTTGGIVREEDKDKDDEFLVAIQLPRRTGGGGGHEWLLNGPFSSNVEGNRLPIILSHKL
jgi:tRNA(Ile)-lysidine synthetase-like protein